MLQLKLFEIFAPLSLWTKNEKKQKREGNKAITKNATKKEYTKKKKKRRRKKEKKIFSFFPGKIWNFK